MLFASYSSIDRDKIDPLLEDLRALGHDVWFDEQVSGGQVWWNEILAQIRACDAFLILVTPASVESEACLAELHYALALDRPVIPVELVAMNNAVLPSALSTHQIVSYTTGTKAETMALTRALSRADTGRPLPDPEPPPPPLPGAYFSTLRDQIGATESLTLEQQLGVLHRLRARADDEGAAEEIRLLLGRFRRRDDLYASVAEQADALQQSLLASASASAPPSTGPKLFRRPVDLLDWLTVVLAAVAFITGLLGLQDPRYTVDGGSVISWTTSDRWQLLISVVVFGVLVVLCFTNLRRVRRVASVLALVFALVLLASWWAEMGDILAERDIATGSGPISLGPGMSWISVSVALVVIVGVLLVVSAFSSHPRGLVAERPRRAGAAAGR